MIEENQRNMKFLGLAGVKEILGKISDLRRDLSKIWPTDKEFNVIYTDGVAGRTVFPDQSYAGLHAGDLTPAFIGTPIRDGYTFIGWSPSVQLYVLPWMANVDNEIVYTAQWIKDPEEISAEEISGAGSPIQDVDVADEMVRY